MYRNSFFRVTEKEISVKKSGHQLRFFDEKTTESVNVVPAYLYEGNNYFKLRDVGKLLGYDVTWDQLKNRAVLIKGEQYKNINDLSHTKNPKNAYISSQTISVNNGNQADIYYARGCINIDGYNYFKLRGLETIMNFKCDWEVVNNTILIYNKK